MKNNPIIQLIQFILILLIGFSVIIGTTWIVNHFEKTIECPNCECHCQNEITEADVEYMIQEAMYRTPKEAFENLDSESIWKGEDLMTRDDVINIIEEMNEERDLMDELYFMHALDGSVSKPKFIPFFCEIYKQCQDKK